MNKIVKDVVDILTKKQENLCKSLDSTNGDVPRNKLASRLLEVNFALRLLTDTKYRHAILDVFDLNEKEEN